MVYNIKSRKNYRKDLITENLDKADIASSNIAYFRLDVSSPFEWSRYEKSYKLLSY